MEYLNQSISGKKKRPIRVLQFGEGNFLRGFADEMIDIANEKGFFDGDIVIVKPRQSGSLERFHRQQCQYSVSLRGLVNGEAKVENRVVSSVADILSAYEDYERVMELAKLDTLRFVLSNTTEAGIVYEASDTLSLQPPLSYPAKLTQLLFVRFEHFRGAKDRGLLILPLELIEENAVRLKECVDQYIDEWKLGRKFAQWVEEACLFAPTLVDRIIPGYPASEAQALWEEYGYRDELIVAGEPFASWVVEGNETLRKEFPLDQAGLPFLYTDDHKPYKERKVRILNGAHTSFVLASYLAGHDTVLESMEDEAVASMLRATIYGEVIPTLSLPEQELNAFASEVFNRFRNPYIRHELMSISLNSVSKWRARCMPTLLAYAEKKGCLPVNISFSLAALLAFYTGSELRDGSLVGHRIKEGGVQTGGSVQEEYLVSDDREVLTFFAENSGLSADKFASAALGQVDFWGQDLNKVCGLTERVGAVVGCIRQSGMAEALNRFTLRQEF